MIVPVAGAGSSMSTLSVEISTTVSPSETSSPTFTDHSRIVPSVTDSPPVGVTISTSRSLSAGLHQPAACRSCRVRRRRLGAPSAAGAVVVAVAGRDLGEHAADGDGVSLGGDDLDDRAGDRRGTSASTLSVEISTIVSSAATMSPSALCHSRTVPSATESPMAGITTSTVLVSNRHPGGSSLYRARRRGGGRRRPRVTSLLQRRTRSSRRTARDRRAPRPSPPARTG